MRRLYVILKVISSVRIAYWTLTSEHEYGHSIHSLAALHTQDQNKEIITQLQIVFSMIKKKTVIGKKYSTLLPNVVSQSIIEGFGHLRTADTHPYMQIHVWAVQYSIVPYSVVLYCTVLCYIILYCTLQYSTICHTYICRALYY